MKNIGGAFTALAPAKLRLWWSGWGQETEPMVGLLDSSCRLYCLSSNKTHLTSLTEQPEQHVGRSMSSTCLQRCRRQCTCQLCLATTSHCLYPLPLNNTQTGHTSCIYVYTTKTKCSRHPKYKAELATFINNKKAPPTPLLIQLHSDNLHDPAAPLATDIDQPIKSFPVGQVHFQFIHVMPRSETVLALFETLIIMADTLTKLIYDINVNILGNHFLWRQCTGN